VLRVSYAHSFANATRAGKSEPPGLFACFQGGTQGARVATGQQGWASGILELVVGTAVIVSSNPTLSAKSP
jgi:hypothetical protein